MSLSSFRLLAAITLCGLTACSTLFDDSLAGGDAAPSTCGNAIVDAGEACDDAVPLLQTCAQLVGPSATGNVRCTACGIDLRGCVGGGGRAGVGGAGAMGGKDGGAGALVGGASSAGFAGQAGVGANAAAGQGGGTSGSGGSTGGAGGLGGTGGTGGTLTGGKGGTASGAGGVSGAGAASSGAGGSVAGNGGAFSGKGGAAGTNGTAGSTSGGGGVSGQGGAGNGGAGGTPIGVGGASSCAQDCGPFHSCVGGACTCPDTSEQIGAGCWPRAPKPAAQRTKAEVCAARKMGSVQLEPGGILETGGMCGPWTVSPAKLADHANRLAYFRWLAGVGPIRAASGGENTHLGHARCAAATAFEAGPLDAMGECSSPETVTLSKRCSRITGPGAEAPIDLLVRSDSGGSFGHIPRRILLSPFASPFFFGFFGPAETKRGSCLEVPLGPATDPADAPLTIWPPAGYVPIELADAPWSIGPIGASGPVSVSVVRSPPGTSLGTSVLRLIDNTTGSPVALIERKQWVPVVDRSYAITVTQEGIAPISYTFEPIECDP